MTRTRDIHPEDSLHNGQGRLATNHYRVKPGDPDLVGTLRLDGRVILLKGTVVKTHGGTVFIQLSAR